MIIVPIKEGENIERALNSVKNRIAHQKAVYVQQLRLKEEQ